MRITALLVASASTVSVLPLTGCSVAPKAESRETFKTEAQAAKQWFTANVKSFDKSISDCGGYIIFPDVGRAGVFFFGGTFGRGAVYDGNGKQIGWARMGSGTLGLQLGAQGYKMAMIMEDAKVLRRFKEGKWTGDVAATAVAANEGAAADAQFTDGVLVYIGDQAGLMAGVNIALSNVSYKNLDDVE
jgi:lipid-binding SYLF domain-containing protein